MLSVFWSVLFTLASASPTLNDESIIRSGSKNCNCVAITFDLCPVKEGDGYNQELMEYLIKKKVPATFFVSGRWIEKHPRETKRLLKIPYFEFGVHGHWHSHLPEKPEERQLFEIQNPLMILKNKYHYSTILFRPAFGEYNETTLKLTNKLNLKFILWTFESGDPDPKLSSDRILKVLEETTKAGAIIPFHANRNGVHTQVIIPRFVEGKIKQSQLKLVKISEMLNMLTQAEH
ncbi:MAG: hypothetical protein A4S09_07745 [Proteobacteria bacterium SG_bin7]|nr:MAG: hypothetical protein A4S09_07745 [Proteobacteria bacterium SG_bin7]